MIEMKPDKVPWTRRVLALLVLLLCLGAMGGGVWMLFRNPNRPAPVADSSPVPPRMGPGMGGGGGRGGAGGQQGQGRGQGRNPAATQPVRTGWRALMPQRNATTRPAATTAPALANTLPPPPVVFLIRPIPGSVNAATIRVAGVRFQVSDHATPADLAVTVKPSYSDIILASQQDVLHSGRQIVDDPATAQRVNATPDQIAKLQSAITLPDAAVPLDDARQEKLKTMYLAYENGADPVAKKDAETKLVTELKVLSKAQLPEMKSKIAEKVAEVQSILTPEQIKALKPVPPKVIQPVKATPNATSGTPSNTPPNPS